LRLARQGRCGAVAFVGIVPEVGMVESRDGSLRSALLASSNGPAPLDGVISIEGRRVAGNPATAGSETGLLSPRV